MKAKALNLKNMIESYVNCTGSQREMDRLWGAYYMLHEDGFITRDTWIKFFNCCAGWHVSEDGTRVLDSRYDDSLVWEYSLGDAFTIDHYKRRKEVKRN